ncbi:MAG: TIGR04219 family outer membrane beta-barrel protein [Gammaproteobacteria bacterium]|nr:TIGR04219 family outer membrane beta-barrel protein [Gammaproteobacteria bacterium]
MNVKNTFKFIAGLLMFSLSSLASADFIGLKVGGGIWDHDVSGSIRYSTDGDVDLKNDLKLGDEQDAYSYVYIEHPVPLIPNVKVSKTGLTTAGSGAVTSVFTYGGINYTAGVNINSELVLDHQDVTLYYEILDNFVSLDIGLTGKIFDGMVTITNVDTSTTSAYELTGTIPMLYAAVSVELPLTGLTLGIEGNMVGIGDSEISDIVAKVSYETSFALGFEAGIRTVSVKLDNLDTTFSSMEFSGPFANLFLHF